MPPFVLSAPGLKYCNVLVKCLLYSLSIDIFSCCFRLMSAIRYKRSDYPENYLKTNAETELVIVLLLGNFSPEQFLWNHCLIVSNHNYVKSHSYISGLKESSIKEMLSAYTVIHKIMED
jgi:hypothetical protein